MDLLIGTNNAGKLHEYNTILKGLPLNILSLRDIGLDLDVEETGTTFSENAAIKARAFARASGLLSLADDSGLCVDALNGGPGLHSARYGGPGLDDAGRRRKLLSEMDEVEDENRAAHFACVIALVNPADDKIVTVEGAVNGHILRAESDGPHGFGYDPLFRPEGYDVTFADLPPEVKDRVSHRGVAALKLIPVLKQLTGV